MCSYDFVPEEDMPELATNDEWRAIMIRARKDHGMTQEQLAEAVGASQVMISKIESGAASSSTYILRICRVLKIPEPMHFANEEQREWSQLGHLLRRTSPDQYQAALRLLRSMVKQAEHAATEEAKPEANGDRPARRR